MSDGRKWTASMENVETLIKILLSPSRQASRAAEAQLKEGFASQSAELKAKDERIAELEEELAAAKSPEVCYAPHENVSECGYCQRDRLALRLGGCRQALQDAINYLKEATEYMDPAVLGAIRRALQHAEESATDEQMWIEAHQPDYRSPTRVVEGQIPVSDKDRVEQEQERIARAMGWTENAPGESAVEKPLPEQLHVTEIEQDGDEILYYLSDGRCAVSRLHKMPPIDMNRDSEGRVPR